MGGDTHSDKVYTSRIATAAATGADLFTHDADVKAGKTAAKVHEKLDAKKLNKAGKLTRESFDSEAHPDSVSVVVAFDMTGSMHNAPRAFIAKLGKLMAILVKKGYLAHPHIMFAAIGDAVYDDFPLQVGQFEAGNEIDEVLSLMVLEGGGGGGNTESYELGVYFLARHCDLDCVKKRGKKGYCFIIGDELPYREVDRNQVKEHIGDTIQSNIRFSASDPRNSGDGEKEEDKGDILAELREKFEVFWIMPGTTGHWNDPSVNEPLKAMFVQNLLRLPDPADICELVATTIGVCEGYDIDTIATDLKDVGASVDAISMATKAVVPYTSSRGLEKRATASGDLVVAGDDAVARL